jgi:hypothetical protein
MQKWQNHKLTCDLIGFSILPDARIMRRASAA